MKKHFDKVGKNTPSRGIDWGDMMAFRDARETSMLIMETVAHHEEMRRVDREDRSQPSISRMNLEYFE
ncbi:MAG: hypothetical protein WC238_03405 [Parcubacteria group bacterium]